VIESHSKHKCFSKRDPIACAPGLLKIKKVKKSFILINDLQNKLNGGKIYSYL
jgi:hypothetical protein